MTTFGFIGSGHIGSTLARLAVDAGHDVVMSNSRGPATLTELIAHLGPRARAATATEAAEAAEIAVVTVPLRALGSVPVAPLAGKVVIDTNNYYPARDGHVPVLDDESTTTSELLQAHLPTSRVVKAFNHIPSGDLATQGAPSGTSGTSGRRALAIAGDDAEAKAVVSAFIDEIGFDVVDAGPLAEGWRFQRDTPGYIPWLAAAQMAAALAAARRYAELP